MLTNEEKIKQAVKLLNEVAEASAINIPEPPKKRIDWSKMPEVLVEASHNGKNWEKRYFAGINDEGDFTIYINGATGKTTQSKLERERIRLIEQPTVTFWQGGECPIPDGVRFEYCLRWDSEKSRIEDRAGSVRWEHNGYYGDIIGYRILGPAEGWE